MHRTYSAGKLIISVGKVGKSSYLGDVDYEDINLCRKSSNGWTQTSLNSYWQ